MSSVSDRVNAILSAMPKDRPVGTWFLVEAVLGAEKAASLGPKKARHLCEVSISNAERLGFIRRLPSRIKSTVPRTGRSGVFARRVDKEIAWVLNDELDICQYTVPGANKAPCPDSGSKGASNVPEEQQ